MAKINRLTEHMYPDMRPHWSRCSGRTTGIALQLVKNAMDNPEVWITAYDHEPTSMQRREVVRIAQRVVEALGLRFFEFRADAIRCCHIIRH
ncbi:hypothetical protein CPT_Ponderosa_029 [Stenotrophomonas phage Ponderosa]|uniref:Uncharacterized protein n=2 Tax=Ponderosavirus TaxID=3424921 RepID=A0A5B9NAY9_9CAUD|nr:hypothetical protein CPT_Ponderosa_029 [Stenotrophomonas phage Ponderosa]